MRQYSCLQNNVIQNNGFHIEPIRDEDRHAIMDIRNEQLFHLRQSEPLTKEKQEHYFKTVVAALFETEKPSQLLFSFFHNQEFVGYGGLVHINWIDQNAEISFVMKTALEQSHFAEYWSNYLYLIEQIAFVELKLHKIFTYAFDLRPHLYTVLEQCGFKEEARLKEHCKFAGNYRDVVYHAKLNRKLTCRKAELKDLDLYFQWTNDPEVRNFSYTTEPVPYENHVKWFTAKIQDENCLMLVFQNHDLQQVGQVRIQYDTAESAVIGVSTDSAQRGKGYAAQMIEIASNLFLEKHPTLTIDAYIKTDNPASAKAFEKAGYILKETIDYMNVESFHYIKRLC